MAAPDGRMVTGGGGPPPAAAQDSPSGAARSAATPLLRRRRHRGLENPLLPFPAVFLVAVGFFLPLGVLILYSFWPTENGRIVHEWTAANYARFFTQAAYWRMLLRSFWLVSLASA